MQKESTAESVIVNYWQGSEYTTGILKVVQDNPKTWKQNKPHGFDSVSSNEKIKIIHAKAKKLSV